MKAAHNLGGPQIKTFVLLSSAVAVFHANPKQSIQEFLYQGFFQGIGTPALGSLIYSTLFAAVCWIPVWLLYRRNIVIKL